MSAHRPLHRRLTHLAVYLTGAAVIVVCAVALFVKLWLMPNISAYRVVIEARASAAIGAELRIGSLETDWEGFNPRIVLRDVRLRAPSGAGDALLLPEVRALVSWWSLPRLSPRLARLDLMRARFPLHRDARGLIRLAGIAVNGPSRRGGVGEWFLAQPRITLRDAELLWVDDLLGAPPLQLSRVNARLENSGERHRLGVRVTPSAAAAEVDVRVDVRGAALDDLTNWSGQAYARVRQADIGSWGQWAPWAQEAVRQGQGELRFWMTLARGRLTGVSGDARLSNVRLVFDKDLPGLDFRTLEGGLGWSRNEQSQAIRVERLRFSTATQAAAEPANLRLLLTPDGRGGFSAVRGEAGNLRLEAFTALASALPLPRQGHRLLDALAPRGLLRAAKGHWRGAADYALDLDIAGAGARGFAGLPAFDGLDARLRATPAGGAVVLHGRGLGLSWPEVFRHDLGFDALDAHAEWTRDAAGINAKVAVERIANADLAGAAGGRVRLPRGGAPVVDLSARLTRAEAAAVYRYLPRSVAEDAYNWLKRALVAGQGEARARLRGDLRHFPFEAGGGLFEVRIPVRDAIIDYARRWPRIEAIQAEVAFLGKALSVEARSGQVLGATLAPVHVLIPDIHSHDPDKTCHIEGRASGRTAQFLDFVRQSPVNGYTGHFVDDFSADGDGVLDLTLDVPLRKAEDTHVSGRFSTQAGELRPGAALPVLKKLSGTLEFSETAVRGDDIRADLLGMPMRLSLSTPPGQGVQVRMQGQASAQALRAFLPAALAPRLSGTADWRAHFGLGRGQGGQSTSQSPGSPKIGLAPPGGGSGYASRGQSLSSQSPGSPKIDLAPPGGGSGFASRGQSLTVESDLRGLSIDLPAPLGKAAADERALWLRYTPGESGDSLIAARYGDTAALSAVLPRQGPARVRVRLGSAPGAQTDALPQDEGLVLQGRLERLDLDAWRTAAAGLPMPGADAGERTGGLPLRLATLRVDDLLLLERHWREIELRLQPNGKGWQVTADGPQARGEVITAPGKDGLRVIGNFKRLAIPRAAPKPPVARRITRRAAPGAPVWVELGVQSLAWNAQELGALRVRGAAREGGMRLDHADLTLAHGRIEGSGDLGGAPGSQSNFRLALESDQFGKLLAQFGQDKAIKGGKAKVSGRLAWPGGAEDFRLAALRGELDLDLRDGQFLKADPGAGRLLGVLSLQALPRRITLDFRDVFSEGFAFDHIGGHLYLEQGVVYAGDLGMNGPAARIRASGAVDLGRETQNLRVRVTPRLEDTVAVVGAILGGPTVGVGTFIANKLLKNPIGQATSFEYQLTGAWGDPVITRVGKVAPVPETPTHE